MERGAVAPRATEGFDGGIIQGGETTDTINNLLDLVYPPRCAFCGKPDARGVCQACAAKLPREKAPLHKGAFGKCAVPLRYDGIVRTAMLRFKFHGARFAARGFGLLLARCAAEELGGEFDCVCWVPVSRQRLRRRGYDQSYLLAREAARLWGTKPLRLLAKRRDTPPQSGMAAPERRANVLGAYKALAPERLRGARVLLIDDILTTGATLSECVRTLAAAGTKSVVCACLASAPPERCGK